MILVTGGTGLIGSHLLCILLKDHDNIRAIHRKSSDLNAVKKVFSYYTEIPETLFEKINWFEADLTDVPALSDAFVGVTRVYHAAAYISFNPNHFPQLRKVNIEGTANVVNLCLANKVNKLVHVSSIGTLGNAVKGDLISENTEWNPEDNNSAYSISKYGAEIEVWRGTQEGLDAVIVNPGIVLGSGFWNSGSGVILKTAAKGIPFYTTGGVGIVDVQDVVKIMISLMQSPHKSERYILVSKSIYYKDLLGYLAEALHKKPPKKRMKKRALVIIGNLDYIANKVFRTKRRLFPATMRSLYTISFYDSSKIEKELNFTFTPYKETLAQVAKNYLKDH